MNKMNPLQLFLLNYFGGALTAGTALYMHPITNGGWGFNYIVLTALICGWVGERRLRKPA